MRRLGGGYRSPVATLTDDGLVCECGRQHKTPTAARRHANRCTGTPSLFRPLVRLAGGTLMVGGEFASRGEAEASAASLVGVGGNKTIELAELVDVLDGDDVRFGRWQPPDGVQVVRRQGRRALAYARQDWARTVQANPGDLGPLLDIGQTAAYLGILVESVEQLVAKERAANAGGGTTHFPLPDEGDGRTLGSYCWYERTLKLHLAGKALRASRRVA